MPLPHFGSPLLVEELLVVDEVLLELELLLPLVDEVLLVDPEVDPLLELVLFEEVLELVELLTDLQLSWQFANAIFEVSLEVLR